MRRNILRYFDVINLFFNLQKHIDSASDLRQRNRDKHIRKVFDYYYK